MYLYVTISTPIIVSISICLYLERDAGINIVVDML